MRATKFLIFCFVIVCITGCNSSARLWRSGNVSQTDFLEEIPFTVEQDLIFVKVNMAGKSFRFILDTGAPNVVTEEVASELGLKRSKFGSVGDSQGGKRELQSVALPPVTLGNLTFNNTKALVADMRAIRIFDCLDVDGLLGSNLMAKTCWQIDYEARTIRMASTCNAYNLDQASPIPFDTRSTFTPIIQSLEIRDQTITNITLDYGSGNGITLPKSLFNESELKKAPIRSRGATGTGLYGTGTGEINYLPAVVPVLGTDSIPLRIREQKNRLLGMDILKQFKATIDWNTNTLFLERQQPGWPEWKSFGFGFDVSGSDLVINTIITPSAAQKAGLAIGDKIVRINNRAVDADDYCQIAREVSGDREVQLTIRTSEGESTINLDRSVIYPKKSEVGKD